MASGGTGILNFDPDYTETVIHVYHGTRVHPKTLLKDGLVYPGVGPLLTMIKRSLEEAGLSYTAWADYQDTLISKGKLNTITELKYKHRQKIWVTDSLTNAWSYARRSPEIVSEAVHHEYLRLHYRRKHVIDEANNAVEIGTKWIGDPVVVVLDAKKLGVGLGCNQPIAPVIPKDVIVEIKTKPERDDVCLE
jgi:hypothetical protein